MKRCPECGTEYPEGAGYCPQDGASLRGGDDQADDRADDPDDRKASGTAPREGWRFVLPHLVSRPSEPGEPGPTSSGESKGGGETGARAEAEPIESPPGSGPRTPGARRRPGRHMSLGAFAAVPARGGGGEVPASKRTLIAYGGVPPPLPPSAAFAPSAAVEPPEESLIGRVLDQRYRLDGMIGADGMAVVYRATHVIINKPLAVKVLRREHVAQPAEVQRFLQEAQLLSRVKHPNVIEVSDYGRIDDGARGLGGTVYSVMEYLRGETLAQALAAGGRIPPTRALAIAIQIARGLAAAHAQGIIHRDLKPSNIFLCTSPEGQVTPELSGVPEASAVKILDFGVARGLDRVTRLTAQGVLVGTPAYMAPEQAQSSDVDPRADLYALGVILFESLTGRVPFGDGGLMETVNQHLFAAPPRLSTVCPALPELPATEALVRHLLAKSPGERPQDASAVGRRREEALREARLHGDDGGGAWRGAGGPLPSGDEALPAGDDDLEEGIGAEETLVGDEALTQPRGERSHALAGLDEADALQPRVVSPSGRIEKRPSVIVRRGTPVERFLPPPSRPHREDPGSATALSHGSLPRSRAVTSPPLVLVIGVAAIIAMALTITAWRSWKGARRGGEVMAPAEDAYVRLRLESSPAGAAVLHDGERLIGHTPVDFQAARSDQGLVLIFRLPGHVDVARTVIPDRTKSVRVDLGLAPVGGAEEGSSELAGGAGARSSSELEGAESLRENLEKNLEKNPEKNPETPEKPEELEGARASVLETAEKRPKRPKPRPPSGSDGGQSGGSQAVAAEPTAPPPEPPKSTAGDLGDLKNPFAK